MPEVLRLPFETKQRMIRWPSPLDRVVTHFSLFLSSVEHKDRGIHVEDNTPGRMGLGDHLCQEPIMELAQPGQGLGCHAQQESSEGSRIGISGQSAQVAEDPIGVQEIRGLDSFEPKDHGIEDGKNHFADTVAVVPLREAYFLGHRCLEAYTGQEAV